MSKPQVVPSAGEGVEEFDLRKSVLEVVRWANLRASQQPSDVREAMSRYFEPAGAPENGTETWT